MNEEKSDKHLGQEFLKSFEEMILSDEALNEYLTQHGYDPMTVAAGGRDFSKKLVVSQESIDNSKDITWTHPSVLKLMQENGSGDPIEIIKDKGRAIVLEAFNRGWYGPPFDLIELAKLQEISVTPYELVHDARIKPIGPRDKYLIEYNPSQSPARINFSLAHEISHTFFSDCAETVRNRETKIEGNSWELEFLCNIGAAELLLPYAEFSNEANSVKLDIKNLIGLAKKYNASVESVFLRFCEVVEKPCAIAIASYQDEILRIDYSKTSRFLNLTLPRNFEIPYDSKVYDCKKVGWTSDGFENWDAFGNEKYRVFGVGLSPIKKQTTPRVGVFFVPQVFDETPSKSIYIVYGDATEPRGEGVKIIAQVINTSGALGFGFGRAMSTKYPESKKSVQDWKKEKSEFFLGNSRLVEISDNLFVFQMLAQQGIRPKQGSVPLSYSSLRYCLQNLKDIALSLNASVHMPAIGAGQAKGDWNIIKGMIYDELIMEGVDVKIYLLPGSNMAPNLSRSLTTFLDDEK